MRKCLDCPTMIHTPTGKELRCQPCKALHRRVYSRVYQRTMYGYAAKITEGEKHGPGPNA